jgi:hypothetical protein
MPPPSGAPPSGVEPSIVGVGVGSAPLLLIFIA